MHCDLQYKNDPFRWHSLHSSHSPHSLGRALRSAKSTKMDAALYKDFKVSRGLTYHYFYSPAAAGYPTLLFLHGFPSSSFLWHKQVDISKRLRRLQAPARLYNPSQATAICGPDCKRVRGLETCRQGRQSARMCSTSTTRDCGARARLGRLHALASECQKPQSVGIFFPAAHIRLNAHIIAARSHMYGMRNKSCIFLALVLKSEVLQANEVLVIL